MLFRIVREVGGMTVDEAEERISSMEVTEWLAIFTLEAEEMEAARKGTPPPRSRVPSPAELRQKIERAFRVAA